MLSGTALPVFGSAITAYGLFFFASRLVSARLFHRAYVKRCTRQEKTHWDSLAPSVVHAMAVMACSACVLVRSPVTTTTATSGSVLVLSASLGYFVADFLLLLANEATTCGRTPSTKKSSTIMKVHHVVSIGALSAALVTGAGHLNILMVLLTEATTPCVALRWILDKLDKKGTRVYLANGILLTVSWIVFRILLSAAYFRAVRLQTAIPPPSRELVLWIALYALPLPLFAMNVYWFYLILRGLVKHLRYTLST